MGAKKLIEKAAEAHGLVQQARLEERVRQLANDNKDLVERLDRALRRTALTNCLAQAPELKPRQKLPSKKREACPVIMVSDLHLEEVVIASTVNGLNEFNPKIADQRMAKLAESIAWEIELERNAFHIDQCVLWFGGDIWSGAIHPDLEQSNAMSTPRAMIFAKQLLVRLVRSVAALGLDVTVVCNDGNHDRLTPKIRVQTRVDNSLGLVVYDSVAESVTDLKNVKFVMPDGILTYQRIFDKLGRFTHGDSIKYGGGIGGITIPITKAISAWDRAVPADHTFIGHWHQRMTTRKFSTNGSLIGYAPFSLWIKADYEPPQQGMVMVDSKRGVCHPKDLWVGEK